MKREPIDRIGDAVDDLLGKPAPALELDATPAPVVLPAPVGVCTFDNMLGKTMIVVDGVIGADAMRFLSEDGWRFSFWYEPDCCANCNIVDIIGDLEDLTGSPMVIAEEVSSEGTPDPPNEESFTWTFYRFATARGTVTVRWLGTSNGYYSESVSFKEEAPGTW